MVRRPAGALDRLAGVAEILDPVFGRHGRDLRRRKTWTAGFGKRADGKQIQRVAIGAHFFVDLETALELALIILSEWARE
jgi:hypothetical protein